MKYQKRITPKYEKSSKICEKLKCIYGLLFVLSGRFGGSYGTAEDSVRIRETIIRAGRVGIDTTTANAENYFAFLDFFTELQLSEL